MKKILSLGLVALTFLATLTGCEYKTINKGNVKLLSMETSINEPSRKEKRALIKESNENKVDYQYIVLEQSETDFYVTINLSNPEDYHILDFNLSCDDKELKVYVDEGFKLLTSLKSINWLGATNTSYTMQFQSESENFLSTLRINKLLYIDREKASIKYNADVSTNNEVNIYKVNNVQLENVQMKDDKIAYSVIIEDNHIENVKVNEKEIDLNKENFVKFTDDEGNVFNKVDLTLSYEINLGNNTLYKEKEYSYYLYELLFWGSINEMGFSISLPKTYNLTKLVPLDINGNALEYYVAEDFSDELSYATAYKLKNYDDYGKICSFHIYTSSVVFEVKMDEEYLAYYKILKNL